MISGVSASLVLPFSPPVNSLADRGAVRAKIVAPAGKDATAPGQLSKEEKTQVDKLKKIDREVKAHEQAHKNTGGQFAGSASFTFVVGPDGKRYAVAGEVSIDVSAVDGDPKATISKMNIVAAAALAPAKPSGQDRRVAAQAAAIRAEAQAELAQKSRTELSGQKDKKSGDQISGALSALAAYDAGTSTGKSNNISGNILDIIG